eukprot:3702895-Rhodomonas_salina.2
MEQGRSGKADGRVWGKERRFAEEDSVDRSRDFEKRSGNPGKDSWEEVRGSFAGRERRDFRGVIGRLGESDIATQMKGRIGACWKGWAGMGRDGGW